MSNVLFNVPRLVDNGAWLDYRSAYPGGYGWRYDRALSGIVYAANHHSVTNPKYNAKADVDSLWSIHKANGWGGIGYNFVITSEEVTGKDGLRYAKVAYVGDLGSVRAHTPNTKGSFGLRAGYGNEDIVAACMIGMLHQVNPTEAQIRSAFWLYRELIQEEPARLPRLKGNLNDKLHSHKTFDPTACSGNWDWQKPQIVNYQDPPKVEVKTETRVATIPFGKTEQKTADLPLGETKVIPGVDGSKEVYWKVTYTNGVETKREITGEKVTKLAVDEITMTGTYVEPEPPIEPPKPPVIDPNEEMIEKLMLLFGKLVDFLKKLFKKG